MKHTISVRPYTPNDAISTVNIFTKSISQASAKDYTDTQIKAWAQVDDLELWAERRASCPAWVAETGNNVIGFADLLPDGYLDMMFVHPEWQGIGVASRLLNQVEFKAQELLLNRIYTEASITAKPFFQQRGFNLLQKQVVEKRGVKLENFLMEKNI